MRFHHSVLAKMSQKLNFGAKSIERTHRLKKEFIGSPFDFKHVAHMGLDTVNLNLEPVQNLLINQQNDEITHSLPDIIRSKENTSVPNTDVKRHSENSVMTKPPRKHSIRNETTVQNYSVSKTTNYETRVTVKTRRSVSLEENSGNFEDLQKSMGGLNNLKSISEVEIISVEESDGFQKPIDVLDKLKTIPEDVKHVKESNGNDSRRNKLITQKTTFSDETPFSEENNKIVRNPAFEINNQKSIPGASFTRNQRNDLSSTVHDSCDNRNVHLSGTQYNYLYKRGGSFRKISLDKLTKKDISAPYNFKHLAHVGLDDIFVDEAVTCETVSKILEEAGVTKKQLHDPETRAFIVEFLRANKKSVIKEQEKRQHFERSRRVSESFRFSTTDVQKYEGSKESSEFTRGYSLNEHHFTKSLGRKGIPPPKPPRLSLQKANSMRNTLQNKD